MTNMEKSMSRQERRLCKLLSDDLSRTLFKVAFQLGYRSGAQYGGFVQSAISSALMGPTPYGKRGIRHTQYLMGESGSLPYPRFNNLRNSIRVFDILAKAQKIHDEEQKKIPSLPKPIEGSDELEAKSERAWDDYTMRRKKDIKPAEMIVCE